VDRGRVVVVRVERRQLQVRLGRRLLQRRNHLGGRGRRANVVIFLKMISSSKKFRDFDREPILRK
jgi:hypothetical protein